MGRSRFPGKPLKFQNRKRVSVLSGTVYHDSAAESHPSARSAAANDFAGEQEVNLCLIRFYATKGTQLVIYVLVENFVFT